MTAPGERGQHGSLRIEPNTHPPRAAPRRRGLPRPGRETLIPRSDHEAPQARPVVPAGSVLHGVRGGPEFSYRLSIGPAVPGFELSLAADFINVPQGNRTELDLTVKRRGGFPGPIDLAIAGLPEGVTFEPARIGENQTSLKLALKAIDDTRPTDAALRITGTAMIDGKPMEHIASVPHLGDAFDCRVARVTLAYGFDAGIRNMRRRVEIRLAGAEADDVLALRFELRHATREGDSGGGLHALDAF